MRWPDRYAGQAKLIRFCRGRLRKAEKEVAEALGEEEKEQ